jgi:hypothetical protein
MEIFKRLFLKPITKESLENTLDKNTLTPPTNDITTEEEPQQIEHHPKASVNLMNRLFKSQKSSQSEPPEFLFENEAWSPEHEFVQLFHKGNRLSEDQDSIPSHS